ncbi:MAG: hypothetical protein QM820_45620 [Minicystis sp.]
MFMMKRALILAPSSLLLVAACGAPPQAASRGQALIEQTTVGKNRCQSDGDEHRLFVVEWDATDLSSFEAKAGRDVVLVRYEGCQMKPLYGCSDDGIAGRFGSYRKPEFTSGTVEGFAIKNEDELNAKLPLGAVTLGGEMKAGKSLDLKYFVSGTVTATRDDLYRQDLASNARCAGATHFVWAYNLGAFALSAADSLKAGATVGVKAMSAGASHEEQSSVLRHGGELDNCKSFDQHACRVPIRVTLRAIKDGARPGVEPAVANAGPMPPNEAAIGAALGTMGAAQLRISAEQKEMAGDGAGCLADSDRADRADPQGRTPQSNMLRGRCEMRAGKCDEGKKHFREALGAWTRANDKTGLANDATLDFQADQMAKSKCPAPGAGGVSNETNIIGIMQKIMVAAASKDTATCIAQGKALEKAASNKGAADDPALKMGGVGGLRAAANCAAAGGKCAEAKELWRSHQKLFDGGSAADADASFAINVPACKGK